MEKKKTLLEKFEIPLHHLDFAYIKDCKDAREIEKIIQILRSGQEGYYPDLTKCAEDKLRELNPNSRLFRYEEKVLGHASLGENEWKPIYDWTKDMQSTDRKLEKLNADQKALEADNASDNLLNLPPVRESAKILKNKDENSDKPSTEASKSSTDSKTDRIKSTEYQKWDKYDADEEILRLELAEERDQEKIEIKNRYNKKTFSNDENIKDIQEHDDRELQNLSSLYDFERDRMAEDFRFRGNDYFRCKEYEKAKLEYTKSLKIKTNAYAFNNRAIANLKLGKYSEAIIDCDNCLELEPDNVKAYLRKAEAFCASGKRRESYGIYRKALKFEPLNTVATKAIDELHKEFGEIPPETATRMEIKEFKSTSTESLKPPKKQIKLLKRPNIPPPPPPPPFSTSPSTSKTTAETSKPIKPKDYNLADLVKPNPNRLVKNKFVTAAEALSALQIRNPPAEPASKAVDMNQKAQGPAVNGSSESQEFKMFMPTTKNETKSVGKNLIEEI